MALILCNINNINFKDNIYDNVVRIFIGNTLLYVCKICFFYKSLNFCFYIIRIAKVE